MLESILENRIKTQSGYQMVLRLSEDEFYQVYEDMSEKAAEEIVSNYLLYRGDDGRPVEVGIRHNPEDNTICITAYLQYTGNEHTEQLSTPDILNVKRGSH